MTSCQTGEQRDRQTPDYSIHRAMYVRFVYVPRQK